MFETWNSGIAIKLKATKKLSEVRGIFETAY